MPRLSNQRRERFAQLVASGESGAAAYRAAYGAEGASAEAGASRLLSNSRVLERVAELQRESATATTLDMQRRREIMAEIANDRKARAADRIAAVLADAKLAGELVEKSEVTTRVPLTPEQISEAVDRSPALRMIGRC
jgi:phage terminase small subunit